MQTTRLGRLLLAALAAGGLIGSAHADFKKVGYVNATRLYSESQTAKKIETGLQREFSPQQKKLAALQRKANEIIFNIIETEHYDAMLSEVIFIRGEFDITDRVIKLLDAEMQ